MSGGSYVEAEDLLRAVYEKLRAVPADDPLALAATHLVRCAMDGVALLSQPESSTANEILGCARAAVTVATYAVREVDGRDRRDRAVLPG
ncbi:hypothetical protein D5S18_27085 [Nocardia panacis]|uniref:Uncharacterized protein n=1 Tax=Nocardia panacis TaxID=2340916 RepID=A0A3A4K0Q1_9NOCA|nr:hypothetical protein [Nocardia panacis]RJO70853.1 hypothetical protein D5S18_27085 [Nocardia panacis]